MSWQHCGTFPTLSTTQAIDSCPLFQSQAPKLTLTLLKPCLFQCSHPFDATSLNGLASKIMRGAYSPINHKYSRGLRSLIQSMLATNPSARPSLEQVLRTPYCKKHLFHFIKDIVERYD